MSGQMPLEKRSNNMLAIGSFAAKTYLAELLRKVEEGSSVIITRNGKDIAVLQSPATIQNTKGVTAWQKLCSISAQLDSPISTSEIEEYKNEGRK